MMILAVSMFPQIAALAGLFELVRFLGIFNTPSPWAMILSYTIFTLPFTVWVLTTLMRDLPIKIEAAASASASPSAAPSCATRACSCSDEPLSNLDAALRVQTRLEIAKLHHAMKEVTMIYVTHDQVEAMTLADRIAVLRDGRLEQAGTPAELYEHPNSLFVAGFIGSPKMNFLTGTFAADHGCIPLGARSEHIEVVPSGPWSGEVLHVEDLGSDHFLFVEIGSEEPVIVRRPGKATIEVGTKLSLAPSPAHLYRFDADGAPIR